MSLARWAKRRDQNEPEIFSALRKIGATVVALDRPCDAIVGWGGRWTLMEVKRPKGRVRASQEAFIALCQESNLPAGIVRNIEDALELIGAVH